MRKFPILAASLFFGLFGCTADGMDIEARTAAIAGGTLERGEPAVVAIFDRTTGGLCTGTVIAPRVVLTAKHCVQQPGASAPSNPSSFWVITGPYAYRPQNSYTVSSVAATPGVWTENPRTGIQDLVGEDLALLTLSRPIEGVEPRLIRRDLPTDQIGRTVTLVGYGERPDGNAGVKYTATDTIQFIRNGVIYFGPSTCQGDSGGPMFQEDGRIIGVTSFGVSASCGTGTSGQQAITPFLDLIDSVVEESGACLDDPPERCDGVDNDCNGEVDEGCMPVGAECETSEECVGGDCREVDGRFVCTLDCDPLRPTVGCPQDFYCRLVDGCDGACVAGTVPEPGKIVGEDCAIDAECDTLFCRDPGDGRRRCLAPCRGDDGTCMAGEVCAAEPGSCNACVAESLVSLESLRRGLGEGCSANEECASDMCLMDGGLSYCTRACTGDDGCGRGFHCRNEQCVAGRREGVGGSCGANEDCSAGLVCAAQAGRNWCASFCGAGAEACPSGFDCLPVGEVSVCAPSSGLVGDSCSGDDACTSSLCVDTSAGSRCSRACNNDSPCSVGFECVRQPDGSGLCLAPNVSISGGDDDDGCSVSARANSSLPTWLLVLGFAAAMRYARRRARTLSGPTRRG